MSDGTRKKKLKLTLSSKNGSPRGSRAGSPDLVNGTKPAQGTSRAASPRTFPLQFSSNVYIGAPPWHPPTRSDDLFPLPPSKSLNLKTNNIPPLHTGPSHSPQPPPTTTTETATVTTAQAQATPFPTGEEVRCKIPPTGITVGELLACFKGAVATPEQKTRFTALMRQYSRFDKATRKLMPVD